MNEEKKTIVSQVKALFASEEVKDVVADIVEESFKEVKTTDGIILNVSSLDVDGVVEIVSEDGKETAPAAEYILEDGSILVVGEEGKISEVKEATTEEEVVEEAMEEEGEVAVEEEIEDVVEEVIEEEVIEEVIEGNDSDLIARIEAIEAKFEAKFKALEDANIILAEANVVLEENFSKIADEPIEKEIKISRSQAFRTAKAAKLDKLRKNLGK